MITLVLGGTRSGKSAVAERLAAAAPGPVRYVATARLDPADADHAQRIARHRDRRPPTWSTVECADADELPGVLRSLTGTVLVDSLGTWVVGDPDLRPDPAPLVEALRARVGVTIVVSEEVGLAPHAPTELGRRFADSLGEVNQAVALVADRVLLVVAGRALELPPAGDPPC
jgi:adenosyl cobinamide kinase/adenosyl cobinamide phosphate guanylyltransferase